MIFQLILLQFIAHLFADFIFQPQSWSVNKRKNILTAYHIYHGVVVFLMAYLLSFDLGFWWAALLLAVVHFITDIIKSYLEVKAQKNSKNNNYFFIDQLTHIAFLVLISILYNHCNDINFILDLPFKATLIAGAFVFCSKPSNLFIKNIFTAFSIDIPKKNELEEPQVESNNDDQSLPNAGKLIGIVERFLVLALVLVGQFSAVGLIIAAKSILRFRSPIKNEYILVGTLLSFGIAVLIGILILQFNLSADLPIS